MKSFSPQTSNSIVAPMQLHARTTRVLQDHEGQRVACLKGMLWITQHNDQRDIVLAPGQSFVVDKSGQTIVFALTEALFTVGPAVAEELAA